MKFAIVGGAGKMGMWIARLLLAEQSEVVLIDRDGARLSAASSALKTVGTTSLGAVKDADIIIISVPIAVFEPCIKELSAHVKDIQTVLDVTSVKEMPVQAMHKYLPGCVTLGAHPIFGPGAGSLAGHNVVLTPTVSAEKVLADEAKAWLEERGARVELMTPQEHDRLMSAVLGLAHFIAIVSGDTLLNLDNLKDMEMASGITFRVLMTLVESVLGEDPSLYASIQTHLPGLPAIERDFIARAAQWAKLVENKDSTEFARRMSELRAKMEQSVSGSGQAYRDMYRLAGDNKTTS